MARVRIEEPPMLKSWDEVNLSLAEIGEYQRIIEEIEGRMQAKISDAKLEAEMQARPHQEAIKRLEATIQLYVEANRDDMGKRKSLTLNFGQVGYRKSTRLIIPRAAAKVVDIINRLKRRGMLDCIVTPPAKLDKNALAKYPVQELVEMGVGVDVQDVFWYEVDREKLKPEV